MKTSARPWRLYSEAFLRLIYPATCGLCNELLEINQNDLCLPCSEKIRLSQFERSRTLLEQPRKNVREMWAAFPYKNEVKELITQIKFYHQRNLIHAIRDKFRELVLAVASEKNYDGIIPIPMDPWKILEREFNFTEMLARIAAQASGVPFHCILKKKPGIPPQSRLNRVERLSNPYGAFKLKAGFRLQGSQVLLIDDILTTGSTTEEAARVLRLAGAKSVDLITLARTLCPH